MVIKELVRLKDGRDIVLNLSEDEHFFLLSFALNALVEQGVMKIGEKELANKQPEGDVIADSPPEKAILH